MTDHTHSAIYFRYYSFTFFLTLICASVVHKSAVLANVLNAWGTDKMHVLTLSLSFSHTHIQTHASSLFHPLGRLWKERREQSLIGGSKGKKMKGKSCRIETMLMRKREAKQREGATERKRGRIR